jgi:hypothetical protein
MRSPGPSAEAAPGWPSAAKPAAADSATPTDPFLVNPTLARPQPAAAGFAARSAPRPRLQPPAPRPPARMYSPFEASAAR